MPKKFFSAIAIVLVSISLYSCISVDRNIRINRDGSGEEVLKITFLKEFYTMISSMSSLMDSSRRGGFLDSLYSDEIFLNKTRSSYDTISGIKIIDLSASKNPDSSNIFTIKYEFDSLIKIGESLGQLKDSNDKSETTVSLDKEGSNVRFLFEYKQDSPSDMPANDSLMEEMKTGMAAMFGSGNINIRIEFPYKVISSNATAADGNTLIWSYP
ncbi:MAG: hypothetical protein M3P82_00585, partial [Bacteroidota bacterium]|nr:hypothetical protein [Bacteroidota bacterium]